MELSRQLLSLLPPVAVCSAGLWQVGFGPGDALEVVFDQRVAVLPLGNSGDGSATGRCGVRTLLAFSPDLPASMGCNATWSTDATALTVVFVTGFPLEVRVPTGRQCRPVCVPLCRSVSHGLCVPVCVELFPGCFDPHRECGCTNPALGWLAKLVWGVGRVQQLCRADSWLLGRCTGRACI
jgi:hypothetical protein